MTAYVVDDHPTMRNAIARIVKKILPESKVVEATTLQDLLLKISTYGTPKLITLDLKLPDAHGVSGVRQVKNNFPNTPLAVISASPTDDMLDHCMKAGADAYIEKSIELPEMRAQLSTLMNLENSEDSTSTSKPSKQQAKILELLCQQKSNADIAEALNITVGGVKIHMYRLYKKIGVKNRAEAVDYAITNGLDH